MSLLPQRMYIEFAEKRMMYCIEAMKLKGIVCDPLLIPKVITQVAVSESQNIYNYYMFHNDPKQMYIFSEKLTTEYVKGTAGKEGGFQVRQELQTEEFPMIHKNKN